MFPLFYPKSKQKTNDQEAAKESLIPSVVSKYLPLLKQWATCLQHQAEKLSRSFKRFVLASYFLLSGGYSSYLVINSFTNPPPKVLLIMPIKVSDHSGQTGEENLLPTLVITPAEYQKLPQFRHYLDSLADSRSGRRWQDSLSKSHPGLMDSLRIIEKRYRLQPAKYK